MIRRRILSYLCLALFLTALALMGCASPSPPTYFYTLTPLERLPKSLSAPQTGKQIVVGIILQTFPEALDRPQIVTRDGTNRLELAEFHRWSGSLQKELMGVLAENLSKIIGTEQVAAAPWADHFKPTIRVFLDIVQFDGHPGKDVTIKARYAFTGPDGKINLSTRGATINEPVTEDGYEALIAAKSRAMGTLSLAIAREIVELSSPML